MYIFLHLLHKAKPLFCEGSSAWKSCTSIWFYYNRGKTKLCLLTLKRPCPPGQAGEATDCLPELALGISRITDCLYLSVCLLPFCLDQNRTMLETFCTAVKWVHVKVAFGVMYACHALEQDWITLPKVCELSTLWKERIGFGLYVLCHTCMFYIGSGSNQRKYSGMKREWKQCTLLSPGFKLVIAITKGPCTKFNV